VEDETYIYDWILSLDADFDVCLLQLNDKIPTFEVAGYSWNKHLCFFKSLCPFVREFILLSLFSFSSFSVNSLLLTWSWRWIP
jgi:hypothetical protein